MLWLLWRRVGAGANETALARQPVISVYGNSRAAARFFELLLTGLIPCLPGDLG